MLVVVAVLGVAVAVVVVGVVLKQKNNQSLKTNLAQDTSGTESLQKKKEEEKYLANIPSLSLTHYLKLSLFFLSCEFLEEKIY